MSSTPRRFLSLALVLLAAALYLGPDNPTLADIAPRLGISAQAVNYRLAGAGAPAIRRALAQWEESWPAPEAADA